MERRQLGRSGLRVPVLGLGTAGWDTSLHLDTARDLLTGMLDHGSDLVDISPTSPGNTAEALLGELLESTALDRHELLLSLSSGYDPDAPAGRRVDCSRRALLSQLDASLRQLGTEYVDVWTIAAWDPATPITELSATMDLVLSSGRARYVAVHGFEGWQLALLAGKREEPLPSACNYSLLEHHADEDLIPAAQYLGSGVIATRPLALGVLASPRGQGVRSPEAHAYDSEHARTVVDAVSTAAQGLGTSPASVALAWAVDRPGVSCAVVGVRNPRHLSDVLDASERRLPRPIRAALDDVSGAAGRLNVRE
ncbi:aldo/keto reductase [Corynebacterium uropygiale]|uniref:Aldo/keto reductase n=1 Tax=Corynebacterium uropygiale TaxID=1775911 RepID=A0A9X1TZ88_9CORY|nr:aldo/keto reductase [Corynebacterium uropygiale]MCF4006636.1 aldo/keto reductase [Corynebacterium uropygiale]